MTTSTEKLILLIDDDTTLLNMMSQFLNSEGFKVATHHRGNDAVEIVKTTQPDLLVLDVMLPGMDGVEICKEIKQSLTIPILMLTAKGDDFTEIMAMNWGADTYLNKPVRPHVLLAHINALLRKTESEHNDTMVTWSVQDLDIHEESYQVFKSGTEVTLTAGEFQLLALLASQAGRPVDRDTITQSLKGIPYDGQDRSFDLRISNLRKKLDDEIPPYKYIKTVRNKGYLLVK